MKHGLPAATSGNKLIDPSIVAFHRKVTRIMTEERYTRWHAFTCARCGDKTAYPAISAIIAYRLSIIENIRCVQYNDTYTLTMNDTIFLSSNFLSLLIREKLKKKKYRRILNISFFFFFPFRLTRAISIRIEYRSRNLNKFALIAERIDR